MADITVISRSELAARRRRLRWQRRWRALKTIWQLALVGSFAGGLVWLISQPGWVIREAEQISVEGTEFLSEETVRSLVPLDYPTSILDVEPKAIAQELQTRGPIAGVVVHRRLFPPGLSIYIRERHPVAVLIGNSYVNPSNQSLPTQPSPRLAIPSKLSPTGLIDENGAWMPLESYTNIAQDLELPDLRLIGMQDYYRKPWTVMYDALRRSPVEVYEIDWRNPANLILNTELGIVHLGSYQAEQFVKQLETLDKMRGLPQQIPLDDIDYIDITSPDAPFIQYNTGAEQYDQTTIQFPMPSRQDDPSSDLEDPEPSSASSEDSL